MITISSDTVNKSENRSCETLFRWLTYLYTFIRSPLCLQQYKEYKLRCNIVSHGNCANSGTNFVSLCLGSSWLSM